MRESDGRRRPGLAGWLTEKVEDLAAGRRKGPGGPGAPPHPSAPDPRLQQQAAELKRLEEAQATLAKELDDTQVTLMGKEAEFKNEIGDLTERNAELLEKIVGLTQRDRELQAKVLDAKFDGTGARDQVKKLDTDLRDQRREVKAKEQQLSELKSQLEALQKEAADRPDPAKTAAEAEELTRRLQEALSQTQTLTKERDGLQAKLTTQSKQLEAAANAPATGNDAMNDDDAAGPRSQVVTGSASDPLKAMAAGKLPEVAQKLKAARERQGAAAEKLLAKGDRGFATLPEGFVEALLDQRTRRSTGEHRSSRRGGGSRPRGNRPRGNRNRNRSRSGGPNR